MKRLAASIVLQVFFIGVVLGQLPEASFYHLERDKELLSSAFISCEQDDYGFIWFGSFYGGGLYRYDGYELKTFVIDPSRIESALTSNNINRIYAPGDDYLYVSTHGGWNKLNLVSGKFLPFAHTHTICPEEGAFYTTKILKDDFSRLWISSHYGLSSLDFPDADIRWLKPKGKNTSPAPEMLRDFIIDHINPNILWLASGQGLFRYDRSIDEYKHISANQIDIRMLAQDHSGKIWVTPSNSDIIFTFDPREEVWASHLIRDSLSEEEFILGLEILANNQIWITTENQVGIFDPLTKNYNAWQYDSNNPVGLLPQGNYYDVLNDRSGRLWIGSWYGVQYSREPLVMARSCKKPISVHIIDIQCSNERRSFSKPLLYTKTVNLLKDQREFEIKFVLPNPLEPSEVEYRYRLKGYDRDWIITNSRTVRYNKVPGGSYHFDVQGKDGENDYTAITSLEIKVEKTLSEYWWFWVISVGLLTNLIIGGMWLRISAIRKEEKLKAQFQQDLAEVQMQALRSQMNPHFLFNCLNSIKYYALTKDKDATADYLGKFSLLVRRILNNSKSDTIDLKDELEAIRLYVEIESLRLENKFDYQINVDSSVLESQVQIPPMVLQPYIENAIWHGLMHKEGRGHLLIQVKDLGERIQCIIEDDGIGRKKSKQLSDKQAVIKKSMGMQITSDRLKLIREIHGVEISLDVIDLVDGDGEPIGTRVLVEIPHLPSE